MDVMLAFYLLINGYNKQRQYRVDALIPTPPYGNLASDLRLFLIFYMPSDITVEIDTSPSVVQNWLRRTCESLLFFHHFILMPQAGKRKSHLTSSKQCMIFKQLDIILRIARRHNSA